MNKVILLFSILFSCGQTSKPQTTPELPEMDRQTKIRLTQYQVAGMGLYNQYCSSCHQTSGEGLASLYPPLKESDFLLEDLPRAACIIRNGQVETIKVNGKTYNQMMPGFSQLTPLEIAEVLTYITNNWGNTAGLSNVRDVESWLNTCN